MGALTCPRRIALRLGKVPVAAGHYVSAKSQLCLRLLPVPSGKNLKASFPRQKVPTRGPAEHRLSPIHRRFFPAGRGTLQTWASFTPEADCRAKAAAEEWSGAEKSRVA